MSASNCPPSGCPWRDLRVIEERARPVGWMMIWYNARMKNVIVALLAVGVSLGASAAGGEPMAFRGLFPPDVKTVGIVSQGLRI